MDQSDMEENNRNRTAMEVEEVAPSEFFVYHSEMKIADIAKESLTHLRVDSSVSEIPFEAFKDSSKEVVVCSTNIKFGEQVFYGCRGLISFELQEGLQLIERGLFSACSSLRKVRIPSSVIKIGDYAFYNC
eukprot:scaffold9494_cov84-Cylindrotheca_fusiformis.AAC.4